MKFFSLFTRHADVADLRARYRDERNERLHDIPRAGAYRDNEQQWNASAPISPVNVARNARQHSRHVAVRERRDRDALAIRHFPAATNAIDRHINQRSAATLASEHHDGCVHAARGARRDRRECDVNPNGTFSID